jgi:electron transport complex protein RnfE
MRHSVLRAFFTCTATNGLGIGLATIVVLVSTGSYIAPLRGVIVTGLRIPVFILIIVAIVTLVDMGMNASLHDPNKVLELFMPLIDTNRAIAERYWRPSRSRGCPSKFARSTCNGRR